MSEEYGHVTGRFHAPVATQGMEPEPLEGHVEFVPRFASARTDQAVILPARVRVPVDESGELSWEGAPGVWLLSPSSTPDIDWTWEVYPSLTYRGRSLELEPFGIIVEAGQELELHVADELPVETLPQSVRNGLMIAPDPNIRGLYVMLGGSVPVDAAGMIPVESMLRNSMLRGGK